MATYKARIFKVSLFFLLLFCATFFSGGFRTRMVYAYDPECVGSGVGKYIKDFFSALDVLGGPPAGAKFLSPAFNMSEGDFLTLYDTVKANAGDAWGRLDGTAGNDYNDGGPWRGYNDPVLARIDNLKAHDPGFKPLLLTETGPNYGGNGWTLPDGFVTKAETAAGGANKFLGALLFNGFCTGYGWSDFCVYDNHKSALNSFCSSGGCNKMGGNSAKDFFTQTIYDRVAEVNYGWVLEIAPNSGDTGSVEQGINYAHGKGLTPVVRIGAGTCENSQAGMFVDPSKYADFVRSVMQGVGGKTVYFIVGPNEPNVEQWASPGCDCAQEDVNARTPGSCVVGQYKLTIKGTIKSSEVFAVTNNSMTGGTALILRSLIPQSEWANYSFTNNKPVNGAIVAVYPSYAFGGLDKFGNTHQYSPGKFEGMLHSTSPLVENSDFVRTKSDGNYEIKASNTCKEVWDYGGWKQYLVVICPENDGGTVKTIVKDLYAFPLNKTNAEVDFGDINVACDADLSESGAPSPPPSLDYVVRDPNKFLACSNTGEFPGANQSRKIKTDINLQFNSDTTEQGGLSIFGWIAQWIRQKIMADVAFHGTREGFVGVQGVSCDVNSMFTSPVGFYGGIKTDYAELAKYFTAGNPDTYNGYEQKLPLPLCAELRMCSQGVSFDGQNDNMQSCGGMANNLRAPSDTTTIDGNGNRVADELGYAARYRNTAKDMPVCKETNDPNSIRYLLSDIAPPEGLCGDTNINGLVTQGDNEMPCPTNPGCGDLDDSGSIVFPETACVGDYSNGSSVTYKFDQRYFPYDALYTGTTEPLGSEFTTRETNYGDSVSVAYDGTTNTGRRIIPFGGGAETQPDNVGTAVGSGMRFPAGFQSTKIPPGNYNSYGKVSQITGSDDAIMNPASLVLASPTDYGVPTSNSIRQSLDTLSGAINFDAETTFYKIGVLENLCTCSHIENTSATINGTQVENCLSNAKNVKIAQPLRNFNELTDAEIRGGGYGFVYGNVGEITNTATALQSGYKYMGEDRQGGNKGEEDVYYTQKMANTSIGAFFNSLLEDLINCGLRGSVKNANDDTIGYKAGCDRIIPTIAKLQTYCPWCKNMSRIKNALISTEAFSEPFGKKVNVVSTCEIDTAATKSQTPSEKQGAGLELVFNESASRSVTQATNAVSSPSFGSPSTAVAVSPGPSVPPSNPGPGVPGTDCDSGCSQCFNIQAHADCSRGCAVNPSPRIWGDVGVQYKKCDDPSNPNYCEGETKQFKGLVQLAANGGEFCTDGGPGSGRWQFHAWGRGASADPGCQFGDHNYSIVECR